MNEKKDFYTRADENIEGNERLSQLQGKEKWAYFKTYYMKKAVLLIVLIVIVSSLFINWIGARNTVNIYVAVVGDSLADSQVEEEQDKFIEYLNPEKRKVEIFIDHAYVADATLLDLKVGMGGVDLIIGETALHKAYPKGSYVDLETVLSKELLEKVKPYLYWQENEEGIKHVLGIDLSECKKYQLLQPSIKDAMIGMPLNGKNQELSIKFIEYLWED